MSVYLLFIYILFTFSFIGIELTKKGLSIILQDQSKAEEGGTKSSVFLFAAAAPATIVNKVADGTW